MSWGNCTTSIIRTNVQQLFHDGLVAIRVVCARPAQDLPPALPMRGLFTSGQQVAKQCTDCPLASPTHGLFRIDCLAGLAAQHLIAQSLNTKPRHRSVAFDCNRSAPRLASLTFVTELPLQHYSRTTTLRSEPMPSMCTTGSSPASRWPEASGVPVMMTSPGSSVVKLEMAAICSGMP